MFTVSSTSDRSHLFPISAASTPCSSDLAPASLLPGYESLTQINNRRSSALLEIQQSESLGVSKFDFNSLSGVSKVITDFIHPSFDYCSFKNRQNYSRVNSLESQDQLTGNTRSHALLGHWDDSLTVSAIGAIARSTTQTSNRIAVNSATSPTVHLRGSSLSRFNGDVQYVAGSLGADTFKLTSTAFGQAILSGNGNVHFGYGYRDLIDLSSISSNEVSLDFAMADGGGVTFNLGNGARKFDALTFQNGSQLLFEGIDAIRFADRTVNLSTVPNDPYFSEQWNLHMMGVQNAWRFTTGSDRVLVGVQDTGLGADSRGAIHPDLDKTLIYPDNYRDEFFREARDAQYGRRNSSHGTSVQGIIGATTNNGRGLSGINWRSPLFNIDVLDANQGDQTLAGATQNMINHARSQGQRLVINMSLGGGGAIDPALERLVASSQNDALFVIAAGNEGRSSLSNPATLANRYSNVIAVGASWGMRDVSGNARTPGTRISYPGVWGSNYGFGLSLMGPSEVITTDAKPSSWGAIFSYVTQFNGTSAATPNVTGVASLVWSAKPNLSASQVKTVLMQTAIDLGRPGYDLEYGSGFVNADAALRRAIAIG